MKGNLRPTAATITSDCGLDRMFDRQAKKSSQLKYRPVLSSWRMDLFAARRKKETVLYQLPRPRIRSIRWDRGVRRFSEIVSEETKCARHHQNERRLEPPTHTNDDFVSDGLDGTNSSGGTLPPSPPGGGGRGTTHTFSSSQRRAAHGQLRLPIDLYDPLAYTSAHLYASKRAAAIFRAKEGAVSTP